MYVELFNENSCCQKQMFRLILDEMQGRDKYVVFSKVRNLKKTALKQLMKKVTVLFWSLSVTLNISVNVLPNIKIRDSFEIYL